MLGAWVHITACVLLQAAFVMPEQVMRTVPLDPNVQTHMVAVTGWLGMMTTVQLPDSFDVKNVRCGACANVTMTDAAGPEGAAAADRRNWAIEVSPQERNIHLRPKEMPTADNPIAAFATNVFVTLDGGHSINIKLRLWDPQAMPALHVPSAADAVVTLTLPQSQTLSARLSQTRAELAAAHGADVVTQGHRWLLERLSGRVHCRVQRWARPQRIDKTVVRLQQLCQAEADTQMLWAVMRIENDGDTPLDIQEIVLESEAQPAANADATSFWLQQSHLRYGESTRAVVSVTTGAATASAAGRWRVRVVPDAAQRQPVVLEHVVFE